MSGSTVSSSPPAASGYAASTLGLHAARLLITLSIPTLLIIASVRVVMTPLFLQFEYLRPGFPADLYGLTTEQRLYYAPFTLNYLVNQEPISYLADLKFPDGTALFNARELRHMVDVQIIARFAFAGGLVAAALLVALSFALIRAKHAAIIRMSLRDGALLTLGMIGAVILLAVAAWDTFFVSFHSLFFAEGTWYFAYSDTLIRLFPEQFWFDAAVAIGALSAVSAIILLILCRCWVGSARFDSAPVE